MNSNFIKDSGYYSMSTIPPSFKLAVERLKDMKGSIIFGKDSPNETELILGDNFEIQVKDGKNYVVRKHQQYPKTYDECCELLGKTKAYQSVSGYKTELLEDFQKLLICCDAYWKIAGDWKPSYTDNCIKYTISNYGGKIILNTATVYNRILSFPTEEMRDAFYENFKELIEECKELL